MIASRPDNNVKIQILKLSLIDLELQKWTTGRKFKYSVRD